MTDKKKNQWHIFQSLALKGDPTLKEKENVKQVHFHGKQQKPNPN